MPVIQHSPHHTHLPERLRFIISFGCELHLDLYDQVKVMTSQLGNKNGKVCLSCRDWFRMSEFIIVMFLVVYSGRLLSMYGATEGGTQRKCLSISC